MGCTIHIVEPTLESETGHCHSFVASLCAAKGSGGEAIIVHAGAGANLPLLSASGVRIVPQFHRRFRRPEAFLLYRKLLREPGRIFVSTAGRTDMTLLSLAAGGVIPPRKAFLYFHWVNLAPEKKRFFRKAGDRQPNLVLLGPTPTVTDIFMECGFRDVRVVPYPIRQGGGDPAAPIDFRHVLFAGAARQDKGFRFVVDYVTHLAGMGADIPVFLQASSDHYRRYDHRTREDLRRLTKAAYPRLSLAAETLPEAEYRDIFQGAVCLQPYEAEDFQDRVSGVTLDALTAGSPVVSTAGTWMARVIERFDAGRVLPDRSPAAVDAAVRAVIAEYPRFRRNALAAGAALRRENDAAHLYRVLTED